MNPPLACEHFPRMIPWDGAVKPGAVPLFCGIETFQGSVICAKIKRNADPKTKERASADRPGFAVGRNPISLLVPCRRVVADGSLTGCAGGLWRKRALLALEGAPPALSPARRPRGVSKNVSNISGINLQAIS